MTPSTKSDWAILTELIALSLIPSLAGGHRLFQLAVGAVVTADNARFFASPYPVVLHIVSVTIYSILGSLQFAPGIRMNRPHRHRQIGWVVVPCGFIAGLSGMWMAYDYPRPHYDGRALVLIRLAVGALMILSISLAVRAIWKRSPIQHGAWMMRSYALGLGAGTQVLTHIPWFLFPEIRSEFTRTLSMAGGWIINLAIVELVLYKRRELLAQSKH